MLQIFGNVFSAFGRNKSECVKVYQSLGILRRLGLDIPILYPPEGTVLTNDSNRCFLAHLVEQIRRLEEFTRRSKSNSTSNVGYGGCAWLKTFSNSRSGSSHVPSTKKSTHLRPRPLPMNHLKVHRIWAITTQFYARQRKNLVIEDFTEKYYQLLYLIFPVSNRRQPRCLRLAQEPKPELV